MTHIIESDLINSLDTRKNVLKDISGERTLEVLNKAKAVLLAAFRGVGVATSQEVADYYEVAEETLRTVLNRHRNEFTPKELLKLDYESVQEARFILKLAPKTTSVNVYTARGFLLIGMILSQSRIAALVRVELLNMATRPVIATESSIAPSASPTGLHMMATVIGQGLKEIADAHTQLELKLETSAQDIVRNTRDIVMEASSEYYATALEQAAKLSTIDDRVANLDDAIDFIRTDVGDKVDNLGDAVSSIKAEVAAQLTDAIAEISASFKRSDRKKRPTEALTLSTHFAEPEATAIKVKLAGCGLSGGELVKRLVLDWLAE